MAAIFETCCFSLNDTRKNIYKRCCIKKKDNPRFYLTQNSAEMFLVYILERTMLQGTLVVQLSVPVLKASIAASDDTVNFKPS